MTSLVIFIIFPFAFFGIYIASFNGLGKASVKVTEAWSGIEVQLKRRHDLIPQLVSVVRSAMKHENEIFDKILQSREAALEAIAGQDKDEISEAESHLSQALAGFLAYTEDNPEITATDNIKTLQKQLEEMADQIAASCRLYNGNVAHLNAKIVNFPGNIVASLHNFKQAKPFELSQEERAAVYQNPSVEF